MNWTGTQRQYNYFKNLAESYADGTNDSNCAVCLEDRIVKQDAGVLPCGHAFCWECANNVIGAAGLCPTCREPTELEDIMQLSPHRVKKRSSKSIMKEWEAWTQIWYMNIFNLDFGSKIHELVDYIYKTPKESAAARFIIFIQFGNLADFVLNALHTYAINNVRLRHGWKSRESALRRFKDSAVEEEVVEEADPEDKATGSDVKSTSKLLRMSKGKAEASGTVKVMILSAQDSVSGLNLTEASHCIILHPFHAYKEEYAVAAEDQGIARVLRNGQTKTVKIVRFIVKNTIEENIHQRGQGMRNVV
ncbi:hypothetical protein HK098_007517 [Nowakowskiella sp. JEL0407]|nr:hypothetical protein HK098_007517 [Nowakowskiella sp. JEL0407]